MLAQQDGWLLLATYVQMETLIQSTTYETEELPTPLHVKRPISFQEMRIYVRAFLYKELQRNFS